MLILLVMNDSSCARAVYEWLTADGHHVVHINAGTSTIERLQQMQPDLLMLSWSWPGESALQVCRDVRLLGNVPIVALGTDVDVEVETSIAALEAGADIFLAPPFKTRELVARVRAIARRIQSS